MSFFTFNQALNNDLNSRHYIHTESCDIFEEILLKDFAKISKQPDKCFYGPVDAHGDRMYIDVKGFSEEEADKLLDYFQVTRGNLTAFKQKMRWYNFETEEGYRIEFDAQAIEPLLPEILAIVDNMPPERLSVYQQYSAEHEYIKLYKLLNDIDLRAVMLDININNKFVEGQFTFFWEKLLCRALASYKNYLPIEKAILEDEKQTKDEELIAEIEAVKTGVHLFDELYNESLSQHESAALMGDKLHELDTIMDNKVRILEKKPSYIPFSIFGFVEKKPMTNLLDCDEELGLERLFATRPQ